MLDFVVISLFVTAFVAGAYVLAGIISFVADLLVELSDIAVELAVVAKDAIKDAVVDISTHIAETVADDVDDITDIADDTDDYITINAVPTIAPFINMGIANNIDIAGLTNIDGTAYYMSYSADVDTNTTDTDVANTTDYLSKLSNHDFYSFDEIDYTNYTPSVSEVSYVDGDALIHVTDNTDVLVDVKGMRKNIALAPKGVCIDEVINRAAYSRNCWNHSRIRKEGKITRVKPEWRR